MKFDTALTYKLCPAWMGLILFFCPSTLLCVTGVPILYFPSNPIICFWGAGLENGRHRQQIMQEIENAGYPPISSSWHWAGSSISVSCDFHHFRTCSHDFNCRQILSVNTGPWLALNFLFILSLINGIRNGFLVFEFQLLYHQCNQIKRSLVENTWSGFYFLGMIWNVMIYYKYSLMVHLTRLRFIYVTDVSPESCRT